MLQLQLVVKRLIDITASLLLSPVALWLFWRSVRTVQAYYPGPMLFWQERVGQHGQLIRVPKLRTFPVGCPAIKPPPLPAPILHIRERGWDELPQLWLVLKGSMSLFGERPLISQEWEERHGDDRWTRQTMRPGLLSVFGRLDHTRCRGKVPEAACSWPDLGRRFGIYYTTNWSLRKDLEVIMAFCGHLSPHVLAILSPPAIPLPRQPFVEPGEPSALEVTVA